MTSFDHLQKRTFDLVFSISGLCLLWPIILITIPVARYSTGASGIYKQRRIGRYGSSFEVYKLRTMKENSNNVSTVTVADDPRITRCGAFFRKTKIDELPQLWNVVRGEMSVVGPRPDVEGFADALTGDARRILQLRPGITGPATIKYRHEEKILAEAIDPERYNSEVVYPDKIRLNLDYIDAWSLLTDIRLILITVRLLP